MTIGIPILALASYPVIYNLPLNSVRLLWGIRHGLAAMPPEVQERAEAADRTVSFGKHLTLLTVVILLMHGSLISWDAAGLTWNNWRSAISLGLLVSFILQGILTVLLWNIPPQKMTDPESRWPLATWWGLSSLGSLSAELWGVFCIAVLISLDVSAWIVVAAVATVRGATYLSESTGRAVGSAAFGGLAGVLFVVTGSLLSPLTMSLIGAVANFYRLQRNRNASMT